MLSSRLDNQKTNKLKKTNFSDKDERRILVKIKFVKPDIVAYSRTQKFVLILDPSIVAVSRSLSKAEKDKQIKYNIEATIWAKSNYGEANLKVHGLILDWKRAWTLEPEGS